MANGTIAVPGRTAEVDFYQVKGKYKGILSWLLTTDHKRIGIMYLCSILFFFLDCNDNRSFHAAGDAHSR